MEIKIDSTYKGTRILFAEKAKSKRTLLNDMIEILESYNASLFRKDTVAVFEKDSVKFNGIIRGVDEFGRLVLELEDEEIRLFGNGEITFKI